METLKICAATQQYGHLWSGVGTYATLLLNELSKRGHEVTIICPDKCKQFQKEGINYTYFHSNLDLRHANWMTVTYHFSKTLNKNKNDYDLIHFIDARECLLYNKKRTPIIGTMHDYTASGAETIQGYKKIYHDYMRRYLYYKLTQKFEKKALKKLDKILCITNFVAEMLNRAYGINQEKLRTFKLAIQAERFKKPTREIEANRPVILTIGNNLQHKGVPTLIRASPKIVREYPQTTFFIVGRDPHIKYLKKLAKKYRAESHFKFFGRVKPDDIVNYYKSSDIYVMPSLVEGMGIVFLEAMASGIPAIGGNIGGTKELIKEGYNGMLVTPGDSNMLAEKVIKLFKDEKMKRSIIKNGEKTVKGYNIKQLTDRTLEVYNELF